MHELDKLFKSAKKSYDAENNPLDALLKISKHCLKKLSNETTTRRQGNIGTKQYWVYESGDGISRPYLKSLFISSESNFTRRWKLLIANINADGHKIDSTENEIDAVLYTASMAFSICYDIWKSTSRKTPGTYLEVLLGSIMGKILSDYQRTKHIPLPIESQDENDESVSTDIVFEKTNDNGEIFGLVIPVKITTRERIVQPFAHQRILDSVFGFNRFHSILICISEMQLDKKNNKVNEICVPGTVRLFQKYLSILSGIYYLDPPTRYLQKDVTDIIKVGSVGKMLNAILPEIL
jgi:hypothetical protein